MATALFVHGISVRQENYNQSFQQIQAYLKQREPEMSLAPCIWGDAYGAALRAGGASIPQYNVTKGLDESLPSDEEVGRWQALYADPLTELRLWCLRPAGMDPFDPRGSKTPSQLLDERLQSLVPSPELEETLRRAGIGAAEFHAARQAVISSPIYVEALGTTSADEVAEFAWAVARAIVAALAVPPDSLAAAPTLQPAESTLADADLRDALVVQLAGQLAAQSKGILSSTLTRAVTTLGTRYFSAWRGFFSSAFVPYVGDILLYQRGGDPIRELIRTQIAGCKPPVVVLAHSLGGVACVELLAAGAMPEVELLVTVGSQAPFFYEVDALQNLRFGRPLPDHFPRWLNIYDRCDFLSFVAAPVFGDPRVEDVEVRNRQPFPWSHTSYFNNTQTWDAILTRLPRESP